MPDVTKHLPLDTLLTRLDQHRAAGQRIVFTNGCFDVIHAGHVRYLRRAADLGEVLVVGLNEDASVRRLKGEGRPIYPESDRAEILAALEFISYVVSFPEDSVEPLIRKVRPDILVKGGDYTPDQVVGADFVRAQGGEVHVLDHVPNRSTTDTLRQLNDEG